MTRKDFVLLAGTVATIRRQQIAINVSERDRQVAVAAVDSLAEALAYVLRGTNANFDAEQFTLACKVEDRPKTKEPHAV